MKAVGDILKKHDGTLWQVPPDITVYAAVEQLVADIMDDIIADHESTIATLHSYIHS
jgi:hypothetical protein